MSQPAPLDGLTVLEVSSFVAAPHGGLTLAQLGADVIRVDPVGFRPIIPVGGEPVLDGAEQGQAAGDAELPGPCLRAG